MLKRMFIYLLLCTFGLLNVPKVYWHDCERQHLHASYDHEHSHDEAQISSSDDCSICDFQFFPFTIHQYAVQFHLDNVTVVHGTLPTQTVDISTPTKFLRGPPALLS